MLNSNNRNNRRGVIPYPSSAKLQELGRLVAGLGYVSESERQIFAQTLPANQQPFVALLPPGTTAPPQEDDSFAWLRAANLCAWSGAGAAVLPPGAAAKRARLLLTFFGGLANTVAYKLGNGPERVILFCGRWGAGGPWLIARAVIIET